MSKRDELAEEYGEKHKELRGQFVGTSERLAMAYEAGWDSALKNSDEVKELVEALEFYAGPWGLHHGYSDSTNEVIQRVLNEKTITATKALSKFREKVVE